MGTSPPNRRRTAAKTAAIHSRDSSIASVKNGTRKWILNNLNVATIVSQLPVRQKRKTSALFIGPDREILSARKKHIKIVCNLVLCCYVALISLWNECWAQNVKTMWIFHYFGRSADAVPTQCRIEAMCLVWGFFCLSNR